MNNPRDEICKQDAWAFIGVLGIGKAERQVPLGVWSKYCEGRAQANSWLQSTPSAVRWEAERLHVPLTTAKQDDADA